MTKAIDPIDMRHYSSTCLTDQLLLVYFYVIFIKLLSIPGRSDGGPFVHGMTCEQFQTKNMV